MSRKAANLQILADRGISVPRGFVLEASHYSEAVRLLSPSIITALPDSEKIAALFNALPTPTRMKKFVKKSLAEIPDVKRFAVRSSADVSSDGMDVGEDSDTVSMAGQFESYLNVPRSHVITAVLRCWSSLFNERSIDRFKVDAAYVEKSRMTVLIQEMIEANASAVMMTADPQGTGTNGAIEGAWGPCEAIVSGMVSPDEIIFDRQSGEIIDVTVGRKELKVSYGKFLKFGENADRVPLEKREREQCALSISSISALIKLGHNIETIFGRPQDIEAVLDKSGRIVITQTRGITSLPDNVVAFSCGTL